ncbi:MAG: sugar dehydrogenase complex small subunit [Pseudomonadota bacterium]
MDHSRRSALRDLFKGTATSVFLSLTGSMLVFPANAAVEQGLTELPVPAGSFETGHFHAFSRLVCQKSDLDLGIAERAFELFRKEPWGIEHLTGAYLKLHESLVKGSNDNLTALIKSTDLTEGELWFISHVITTWYLGIYYHESLEEPVRLSFEDSLMWRAVEDFVTPPGFGTKPYGHWSRSPITETDGTKP